MEDACLDDYDDLRIVSERRVDLALFDEVTLALNNLQSVENRRKTHKKHNFLVFSLRAHQNLLPVINLVIHRNTHPFFVHFLPIEADGLEMLHFGQSVLGWRTSRLAMIDLKHFVLLIDRMEPPHLSNCFTEWNSSPSVWHPISIEASIHCDGGLTVGCEFASQIEVSLLLEILYFEINYFGQN